MHNQYEDEQAELLQAILELEEIHKWTLGYLGMTTQLAFENKLSFKAGLKRVTNCMRKHGVRANVRKKKRNRVKRYEEYVNDNLLTSNLIGKVRTKFGSRILQKFYMVQTRSRKHVSM